MSALQALCWRATDGTQGLNGHKPGDVITVMEKTSGDYGFLVEDVQVCAEVFFHFFRLVHFND